VDALIPLYAIGVFLAFTLSQLGMVVHWKKEQGANWQRKAFINGIGAAATLLVLGDIAYEKFTEGAWAVIVLIVLLFLMFRAIAYHYDDTAAQLRLRPTERPAPTITRNTVIVLVPGVHRGVLPALEYAKCLSGSCRAVYIEIEPDATPQVMADWECWGEGIPLVLLKSPYRSMTGPLLSYLDQVEVEERDDVVTVVIPEAVPTRWWHHILHGQTGLRLKLALLRRDDIIVSNVRYPLRDGDSPALPASPS
jgi:hypothetical protein